MIQETSDYLFDLFEKDFDKFNLEQQKLGLDIIKQDKIEDFKKNKYHQCLCNPDFMLGFKIRLFTYIRKMEEEK